MADDNGAERRRDYFKYISMVDAGGLIATLAIRRELGEDFVDVGVALFGFGTSLNLCILGMFVLTRDPGWAGGELIDWGVVLTLVFTSVCVTTLVVVPFF